MKEDIFSYNEAVSFGWETMKKNIKFFVILLFIALLIVELPGFIGELAKKQGLTFVGIVLMTAGVILNFVVKLGFIRISLNFCDGVKSEFDELLSSFGLLTNYIWATILYVLIIVGGLVLFIVPGCIWAVKFNLFSYFMVEKGLGPIEALKASALATEGAKWDLATFGVLMLLINIAGFLCFVVGLFATIPTTMIAYAYVYKKLAARAALLNGPMPLNPEI
ncbi:MAG: hypothetical protein HY807_09455 [Nitrospirae bacterium]|nr:hypothetical protein [Nitrospirota bacterium]